MFKSSEKSESGEKSIENRPKSDFLERILFLGKIQWTVNSYGDFCNAQRRFFDDLHVLFEVNKHDISKENEKAID